LKPIKKDDLKGKFVQFLDKNWQHRIGRVSRISGRMLTLKIYSPSEESHTIKKRIHLDDILGRQLKSKLQEIES